MDATPACRLLGIASWAWDAGGTVQRCLQGASNVQQSVQTSCCNSPPVLGACPLQAASHSSNMYLTAAAQNLLCVKLAGEMG